LVDRWMNPPFRHVVVDTDGIVVLDANKYEIGQKLSADEYENFLPLEVGGKVVAYVETVGAAQLTEQDERYLSAIKKALIDGALIAVGGSVVLGVIFGSGMSRTLRRMTRAIRKMQEDSESEHPVPVTSRDEMGDLAMAFNDMNSKLAKAHRELRELSILDPLTNLYNRRHFDEQARQQYEESIRYGKPMSIMIGDLDHFKRINDEFSHEMGDRVLERISEIIRRTTRKSDIVARYGGEEFVILFPNTSNDKALVCCENIRKAIESHPWDELHPHLGVTMSMGICDDITTGNFEKMLSQADQHLYFAKETGRNKVISRSVS